MKRVLVISIICLIAGYLIYAVIEFKDKPKDEICSGLEVEITGSVEKNFLEPKEIERIVAEKGLNPKNKFLKEINTDKIEQIIQENKVIKKAEVFITNTGTVKAYVYERTPVLRVISTSGENYYIDDEGKRMQVSSRYAAYLPLATGHITEDYAIKELYPFAQYLRDNKFWNAQIEQIYVQADKDIILIPRVGDQKIVLGKCNDFEGKLDKLMAFYQKGLNEIGWNKYSVINLEYNKQVVGKKR